MYGYAEVFPGKSARKLRRARKLAAWFTLMDLDGG
jgi:hypothetical protein